MSVLEKLGYGGIVTVIGMVIVFVGLIILVFCVKAMGGIFKSIDQKKEAEAQPAPSVQPAPAPVPAATGESVSDPQLIAVIAAALAAFDDSGKRLVIRKVRRVNGWKDAARSEQIYRF